MSKEKILISLLLVITYFSSYSQDLYNRVEARISIKEIFPDGQKSLMMGKVFYDSEFNNLIYRISFPEKELMVLTKNLLISEKKDSVFSTVSSPQLLDFSIYKLILNGQLRTFGLDESKFELGEIINKGDGKVISEWIPKVEDAPIKIVISQKDNLIDGIALFDAEGNLKSKQLFKDYTKYGRVHFPHTIYEFSYSGDKVYKKLINHSEIKLNDYEDEKELYHPDFDHIDSPSGQ